MASDQQAHRRELEKEQLERSPLDYLFENEITDAEPIRNGGSDRLQGVDLERLIQRAES